MTVATQSDRKLATLYASLTPVERARLIARSWREHTGEIDAIRDALPDATAGRAYNRAVTILRELHDVTPAMIVAVALGIDKWTMLAGITYDFAATPRNVLAYLSRFWWLLAYPVTEREHRRLLDAERAEPTHVAENLVAFCPDLDADEPGLHPDLAAIARDRSEESTVAEEADLLARAMRCFRAAVRVGELPKPTRRAGDPWPPVGILSDWAGGTTAGTFRMFGPAYHVPEVEFFGGGLVQWEIRPDAEAEAVRARRAEMLGVLRSIARDGGDVDASVLAQLTLEPPATAKERARRRALVQDAWPWAMGDDLRDELRNVAAGLRSFRTELRTFREAISRLQETEFGGEDPLDSRVRDLLAQAEASDTEAVRIWGILTEAVKPYRDDAGERPPSLDDDEQYAELLPGIERLLRDTYAD